jgi:imidazole glycerol-phosphate synthase subunit HisH
VIAVIDYGMGNLRSVQKAFETVGAQVVVTRDPKTILGASSAVLPGVGAFKDCMDNLREYGLLEVVHQFIKTGKPFLGICLGLQVLFSESEEFGNVPGLGVIPGKTLRFNFSDHAGEKLKIPHMGWNSVHLKNESPLFKGIPDASWFYFVHSYYVAPEDSLSVCATADYGSEFVCGIHHDNVHAFQFHPEKSQALGLKLLKNFSLLK